MIALLIANSLALASLLLLSTFAGRSGSSERSLVPSGVAQEAASADDYVLV